MLETTEDERKAQLRTAAEMIRVERRKYNNLLRDVVEGKAKEYNAGDLVRLCGSLEAAYNHCLESIAGDSDIFCISKHISYSLILAGEMDQPDVEPLYDILAVVTNGKVEACSSCRQDSNAIMDIGESN